MEPSELSIFFYQRIYRLQIKLLDDKRLNTSKSSTHSMIFFSKSLPAKVHEMNNIFTIHILNVYSLRLRHDLYGNKSLHRENQLDFISDKLVQNKILLKNNWKLYFKITFQKLTKCTRQNLLWNKRILFTMPFF